MAKTPVNSALVTVRGGLDGWVYRRLFGTTVIAKGPEPSTKPASEAQVDVRERFRRSALYARAVYADPVRKARYARLAELRGVPLARLFAFIVQDYATPPVISSIDLSAFRRKLGDPIRVYASDDGELTSVEVVLKTDDGTVLEQGPAMLVDAAWVYATKAAYPDEGPITVDAIATDLPGNGTTKSALAAVPA